jgi:photosystem II stability/assembly factor-like uncharacterized protein
LAVCVAEIDYSQLTDINDPAPGDRLETFLMLRFSLCFVLLASAAVRGQEASDPNKVTELRTALAEAEKKGKESLDAGLATYQLGKALLDRGLVAEGEVLLDRSLAIHEKAGATGSLNATLTRAQLARLYKATGRADKGKALEEKVRTALKDNRSFVGRQVLAMFDKPIPGVKATTTTTSTPTTERKTTASSVQKKAPEAAKDPNADKERKLRENLAAAEKALGKNNKDTLQAAQELGVFLADQGKFADAEAMVRRAVDGWQQPPTALGVEHGRSLVELSRVLKLAGKAELARDNGATAVAILERALGKDHPDVAAVKKRIESSTPAAAKATAVAAKETQTKSTTRVATSAPASSTANMAATSQPPAANTTPPVVGSASLTMGQALDPAWAKAFRWRTIGPTAMGGRVVDLAICEKDPTLWYVASASGGLFKTTNAGTTFEATFDREATVSIGDVCIAPSNPDIVWVGTGENNARNSASWGDGVYRSLDGGKTWQNMGLRQSFQIGKVIIHPNNPDVVYVGVLGRLWGENAERGVFKTIDGGKTWEKVLFVDAKTGCIDLTISPEDPETLIAAMYERQRDNTDDNDPIKRWGPGSGMYRTNDGGRTWTKLTKGLPSVKMGRVGFSWYRANPKVVYAIIETERSGDNPSAPPTQQRGRTAARPAQTSGEGTPNAGAPAAQAPAQPAAPPGTQERERPASPGTGYMGVQGATVPTGAQLTTVTPDGPAARAGLRDEDIVTAIDGKAIKSYDDFINFLAQKAAGDRLKLDVSRGPEKIKIDVTLGQRPEGFAGGGRGAPPGKPFGTSLGGQVPNVQDRQGPEGYQTGGIYRSADAGVTWTRINSLTPRPFYFSRIEVDPKDEKNLYVLGIQLHTSKDGGKTFDGDGGRSAVHADHHAIWVNPADPRQIIIGCDGGLYVSHDRMQTWDFLSHIPMSQFYHVAVDTRKPYSVYGGLQDNQSWGGPSATRRRNGPAVSDWINLGGGDGFVCACDPTDPDVVYYESQNGGMARVNLRTGEGASLRPPVAGNRRYRFNWKTPFVLSHHNPRIFYAGGNFVFRCVNRGSDLKVISPEITNTPKGTATAIAESPRDPNVLYVGTDDGALWVTQDGGQKWTNLKDNLKSIVPPNFWVDSIECSRFAVGRVYAALDCHRTDNDEPFPVVSEDFGKTWKSLRANLPTGSTRVVREDRANENLLYCGTEFGLWASINRGENWTKLTGLPTVAVHEVAQPTTAEELVVATHGRGIWIMELAPLRQTTKAVAAAETTLFKPASAYLWNVRLSGSNYGHRRFNGENPASEAVIYYSLRRKAEKTSLKILDIEGKTVRELTAPKDAGLNRVTWDRRRAVNPVAGMVSTLAGPQRGQAAAGRGGGGAGGGGGRGRGGRPTFVEPGVYRVVLNVDGKEYASSLKIEPDPDTPIEPAALDERMEAIEKMEGNREEKDGEDDLR